ncbi:SDR family NAD(P)-dependent oxidoreductase [Ramlibacter henchirensis]|nr:SDR family NAD(P)-dependent oxidoreductase [Ramlibacter henchirensis]
MDMTKDATPGKPVRLDGKVAIVTGSAAGWGRSIAECLAERGAYVAINGRQQAAIDEAVSQINAAGGRAIGVPADVSDVSQVERLIDTVRSKFGRLDIMINNAAGSNAPSSLLDMTNEDWDSRIASVLNSVFYGCRAAARAMVAQGGGGRIINMVGATGLYGMAGTSAYASGKGAVLTATYSWALELAEFGVTVNAVRAGVRTATTMPRIEKMRAKLKELGQSAVPSARDLGFFEPHEAAGPVVWLASEAAAHVTGRLIGIDGPKVTIYGTSQPTHQLFHEPFWDVDTVDAHARGVLAALPKNAGIVGSNPAMGIQLPGYKGDFKPPSA